MTNDKPRITIVMFIHSIVMSIHKLCLYTNLLFDYCYVYTQKYSRYTREQIF